MFCFSSIIHFFWGDMSQDELKRFGILSATYFFLIGAYWLIRVMKDPIFEVLVGFCSGQEKVDKKVKHILIV